MKKGFFSGILLMLPVLIIAQQNQSRSNPDSAYQLEDVIVTATKTPSRQLLIPYSVNKLTSQQLVDYQFRTAPEALAGSTGIFIQKTNHGGGSPFVRGLTGNQNLLMIDGIRLNNSTYRYGPNQYFNTVDIYNIGSIEVVRGTGSVQYGSDAMGGVIQVFTKEPAFADQPGWGGTIYGKGVAAGIEYSGRAEVGYRSKKLAVLAGYTARSYGDLPGGDSTGVQQPSGYNEQSMDLKVKWKISNTLLLSFAHQQTIQHDVPLYHRVRLENFNYYLFEPQQRKLTYLRLEQTGSSAVFNKLTVIVSAQQNREVRKYLKNGAANQFKESDRIATVGLTADIASVLTKNWTVNSGIELYHDKVNSSKEQISVATGTNISQRGLYPDNSTSSNFSVYSMHHVVLNRFQVEAGLRYNQYAIRINDTVSTAFKLGTILVRPSSFVSNFSLLYKINPSQSIYGSFSTGYRAPNIDDMGTLGLVDFRYEIPAYDLKPEMSYNTEIGYRYSADKWKGSLAFFNMQLTGLITRVQVPGQQVGGYNVYTKENNQQSVLRGFEMEFSYRLNEKFSLQTNAAYALGQNTSRNEPLRRVPPFNGRTALQYKAGRFSSTLENSYAAAQRRLAQGDKDDNRIPAGGTPGWYVMNLYAGYELTKLSFHAGLMNIFNTDYRTHGSGINGVGRNLYLGFKLQF